MSLRLALLCCMVLTSCVRLAPEPPVAIYVEHFTAVAGCELRGVVQANPPYWSPKTAAQRLQGATVWLGGNTLLLTEMNFWTARGLAYQCAQAQRP